MLYTIGSLFLFSKVATAVGVAGKQAKKNLVPLGDVYGNPPFVYGKTFFSIRPHLRLSMLI